MEILNQKDLKPSLAVPKPVKILSKNLNNFSPYLATRLASHIFRTPVNFKRPEREKFMYKSAQKTYLSIPKINKKVEVLTYGYSPKKVLFVHGWAGRSTQLYAFADKLLEKGFMVVSFDGTAHGKSTGKQTNMIEFIETIKIIENHLGPFVSVIGHSFGAMSTLNAASIFLKTNSLVSIGSGDRVSGIMQRFTNSLGMNEKAGPRLQRHSEAEWKVKVDDFASDVVVHGIDTPILIVHDTLDGDVPVSCAYRIRQNTKKGKLLITHGLGHTKILRDPEVVNKVVEFIIENK